MVNKERHDSPSKMLRESLDEMLFAAGQCLNYRKRDLTTWPSPHAIGGILGYPAATLLFVIVDSIGSYYRDNKNIKLEILVDGECREIKGNDYENFFILNSQYFGLSLSEEDIQNFYLFGRCTLVHNSR